MTTANTRWDTAYEWKAVTLLGLGFNMIGWTLPGPVNVTMQMLGEASIPLLLFSLGVRLTEVDLRDWRIGALGAVLCPLTGIAMVLMLRPLLDLTPLQSGLFLVFGALPPAVLNFLVAEQFNQEPKNVASIVLLGNLAATVAIPLVLFFALR